MKLAIILFMTVWFFVQYVRLYTYCVIHDYRLSVIVVAEDLNNRGLGSDLSWVVEHHTTKDRFEVLLSFYSFLSKFMYY